MLDLISPDAFSSLWYWVVLALVWTRAFQMPLGVPIELCERAVAMEDGEDDAFALIRLGVGRHLAICERLGPWLVGAWAFLLSALLLLSALYRIEIAQAVLLLMVPMALVQGISTWTARRMAAMTPEVSGLMRELRRLRTITQVIGLSAIFVSALYGMVHTLNRAVF